MSDKYCKDCRHKCIGDYCMAPQLSKRAPKYDLVHGPGESFERRGLLPSCFVVRELERECGPGAKWFEPVVPPETKRPPPWWRFWE